MTGPLRVQISSDVDVVRARQAGREMAAGLGFSGGDQTVIAAAISEIARNILMYARQGEMVFTHIHDTTRDGMLVVAEDHGLGIRDVARALQDGYSTPGGLGLGLPGARRVVDDFEVVSEVDKGTRVTMKKWKRANG